MLWSGPRDRLALVTHVFHKSQILRSGLAPRCGGRTRSVFAATGAFIADTGWPPDDAVDARRLVRHTGLTNGHDRVDP
jgi:hypothetical protein